MGRSRHERVLINRIARGDVRRVPDELIVEEPLTIQVNGTPVTTTMRTPGHDFELAVGWCHTEGLLAAGPPTAIRYCSPTTSAADTEYNVVNVTVPDQTQLSSRLATTTSSCGWCGSDQIDELVGRIDVLPPTEPMPIAVLESIPDAVRRQQQLFDLTGGVHAAAAFDRVGDIALVREDVGRHNAVDKVIGAMVLAGDVPASDRGLFVSGRASVEIIQKAWSAGFSAVVAVSAPTALAVSAARRANLMLAGFARSESLNVYAPERWSREEAVSDTD